MLKLALKFAAMASGGSFASSSVTPLAVTLITQLVLAGRSLAGSITTLGTLSARALLATGVPAGHSTLTAPAATSTFSLKLTVIFVSTATFVAASAGVVPVTVGALSPTTIGSPVTVKLSTRFVPPAATVPPLAEVVLVTMRRK